MIDVRDSSGKICHKVFRLSDFGADYNRKDVSEEKEFLQCAILNMPSGKTFNPHKHIWKKAPDQCIAQESWCVVKGKVEVFFYDEAGILLTTCVLEAGDASFTYYGGHTYKVLEDAFVYEYTTGTYEGILYDKVFL